jgi:hypothetical protein
MQRTWFTALIAAALLLAPRSAVQADGFDLQYSISNTSNLFSPNQISILNDALTHAEHMWETMITGYKPGITIPSLPITVYPTTSGLASASFSGSTFQGGYHLPTSGFIYFNVNEVENFANWQGVGANGLNFVDEVLAHETGHVLGIGTLWVDNGLYVNNSFQYTGAAGLAAYQAEFDPAATFVPVENAGAPGTPNAHWDQRMRSSVEEGNPVDPWSLDPRVGVVDSLGRDRGLELLTGAIDPDYGQPFVSRFTVQSLTDMGYAVTEFEDFNGDGVINVADRDILMANMGATGLQIDSMAYGDANRDRQVDAADLALWRQAAGVPEPLAAPLALTALATVFSLRKRRLRFHRI